MEPDDERAAGAALVRLAGDDDLLVRAAALSAAGELGCPAPLLEHALAAVAGPAADPAWQVRAGAARAIQGALSPAAGPGRGDTGSEAESGATAAVAALAAAVAALAAAGDDAHADVRKAAVIALGAAPDHPGAADALTAALADTDADVRGYARRALAPAAHRPAPAPASPAHAAPARS
jgi:HEAT repeat protein